MRNIITQEEKNKIDEVCKKYKIENYIINRDGSIDVDGDVDLVNRALFSLPLQFNKVRGGFYCGNNNLTSLEHCPKEVGGNFVCDYNRLTSLEHCPSTVGGDFNCSVNNLTSLKHCPGVINHHFYCDDNKLTSLEFCPKKIRGYFNCTDNKLSSLEFAPTKMGSFNITSLNNFPPKFVDLFCDLHEVELFIFLKYQHHFFIWDDGGYYHEAALDLVNEIKTGLL